MKTTVIPAILTAIATAVAGCDRESGSKPGTKPAPAGSVVFRSPDGRVLSREELKNVSGTFKYEIVGGEAVPDEARALHQQARDAGSRGKYDEAIALLQRASTAAPRWPYPVYDLAFTYLLKEDYENARLYYRKTLELSPRGYFTAITALDTLERERKGDFRPGLYLAYVSLEWMDDSSGRADVVRQLAERQPAFAPGLKERALLAEDDEERLQWIEKALAANPDGETKGILLINKALVLDRRGEKEAAVKLLGELALDPTSTFATEHLAKATLSNVTEARGG